MWTKPFKEQAYSDHPLPIGDKQTISQPYIVALMSESLGLRGDEKVLEIGTGSGYQAAVLAELAERVFSIERFPALAFRANQNFQKLGYKNIIVRVADGTMGWPDEAPFDAVVVTAGTPKIPQPLVDQLGPEGRMVIPVGDRTTQELFLVERVPEGIRKTSLGGVRFVDLVGQVGMGKLKCAGRSSESSERVVAPAKSKNWLPTWAGRLPGAVRR